MLVFTLVTRNTTQQAKEKRQTLHRMAVSDNVGDTDVYTGELQDSAADQAKPLDLYLLVLALATCNTTRQQLWEELGGGQRKFRGK